MKKLSDKKRLALVLSGGGVKAAAFHIGACLALREKGFKFAGGLPEEVADQYPDDSMTFKMYVGSSAGAVMSSLLASGYSVEAIIEAFTRGAGLGTFRTRNQNTGRVLKPLTYRDIFALNIEGGHPFRMFSDWFQKKPVISGGLEVLLKKGVKVNGIFSMRNIERYMRKKALPTNEFSDLGVNLYICATQLNHSREVIFGPFAETTKDKTIKYANYANISDAVAASASLPPAFAPWGIHKPGSNKTIYFFDGEIRDTLSTHVAETHGADLVISSYSIQPYHYSEEMGSLHNYGIPVIMNQALYQTVQQKIDAHIRHQTNLRKLMNSVNGYLKEIDLPIEQREKLMEILRTRTDFRPDVDRIYIHPSPQDYKMFFYDHFSLNPIRLSQIVRTGFRSAMQALRQYNV